MNIKKILSYKNQLCIKYGSVKGIYLFILRYLHRKKYYECIIKNIEVELKDVIIDLKLELSNSKNNTLLNQMEKVPVWFFWYQGKNEMPFVISKCLKSIRECFSNNRYEINIIDKNNISNYIDISDEIYEKLHNGNISVTHFSDILRFSLLRKHGGYWIDSTCFFVSELSGIDEKKAFFTQKYEKGKSHFFTEGLWSSFFLASVKNSPIAIYMNRMFEAYWKRNDALVDYFLIDIILMIGYRNIPSIRKLIDDTSPNNPNVMFICENAKKNSDSINWNKIFEKTHFVKLNWRFDYTNYDKESVFGDFIEKYMI